MLMFQTPSKFSVVQFGGNGSDTSLESTHAIPVRRSQMRKSAAPNRLTIARAFIELDQIVILVKNWSVLLTEVN